MKQNWKSGLIFVVVAATCAWASQVDLSKAKIVVLSPEKKIMANAGDMLRDEIENRTRISLEVVSKIPAAGEVAIMVGTGKELAEKSFAAPADAAIPSKADGYSVWVDTSKAAGVTICAAGYDDRGTLFAVGRLLRLLEMSRDKLGIDSKVKAATSPKFALRGHQLGYRPKTNSYDAWTIGMWEQYYRDMIVFGMNAIELIPPRSDDADDSPHFPTPQLEMMVRMSQVADNYGLDVWIWFPAIDKDYTDAKTVDAAMEEWGEVFRKLPRIDVVFVPGGDPGNTDPKILLPFMEKQKKNLNKYHPKAQMWVSPQGFDRSGKNRAGWLKSFYDILQNEQPKWLDGVVFGPQVETTIANLRKEVPARYPIRSYPDITHSKSCQYPVPDWDSALSNTLGREPINPRPMGYAKIFREEQPYMAGFITYSEGCNDDFNKVLWSCLGWDPDMKVEDIAVEYGRYFIGQRDGQKFGKGLLALERNWVGPLLTNEGVYTTLALFQDLERNATPQEKLNWRFQQGLYRAYYDAYERHRLIYATEPEKQVKDVLKKAAEIGSLAAMEQAEKILDKSETEGPAADLRARTFELAEALFQSIRMQLSVPKYQAIKVNRGANLDEIDKPLKDNKREDLKKRFAKIRSLDSESERLIQINAILK